MRRITTKTKVVSISGNNRVIECTSTVKILAMAMPMQQWQPQSNNGMRTSQRSNLQLPTAMREADWWATVSRCLPVTTAEWRTASGEHRRRLQSAAAATPPASEHSTASYIVRLKGKPDQTKSLTWQLIGKSQWCCSTKCGCPLHVLMNNCARGKQPANTPPRRPNQPHQAFIQ